MKWLWRALLVLCLIPFFLPGEGHRELRNLPLLLSICLFFLLCITYRLACMHLLYRKVRSLLLQGGYTVERPRMYLYSAFLLAKRGGGAAFTLPRPSKAPLLSLSLCVDRADRVLDHKLLYRREQERHQHQAGRHPSFAARRTEPALARDRPRRTAPDRHGPTAVLRHRRLARER